LTSAISAGDAWPAPAKLNLTLRVLGRRPDGYHQLQTVFQFIERADLLHFEVRADGRVRRVSETPGVPADADLVVRAARLLKEHSGCPLGADIRVDKRLPIGGGLGGGSSDAATTLVALDRLWGLGLSEDDLMRLGLSLGADVPVFVRGLAAWGEGVGERLSPIELPEPWYLVLVPACHVSTADVFSDARLTRNSPPIRIADFLGGDDRNDCQAVARTRYLPVAQALDWLDRMGRARLTGTGACVFAAFPTLDAASVAYDEARTRFDCFVARGINRSPLLVRAQSPRFTGASPSG
jgi:4-diphosphocytidyl-2-C-methyl-D-erythritol kinase